jgi:hypothetical protein
LALTPQNNDAFFREVDDEVRREKMAQAVRRYGVAVAVVVVLGLVALGGWLLWRNHRDTVAGEHGEQLTAAMAALSAGNAGVAAKQIDAVIATGANGYAPLAKILRADMAIQTRKDPEAVTGFMAVANDSGNPQALRDLALVRATALAFDTLPAGTVIARMQPLAEAGKPWFGSAGELAALAMLKAGRKDDAGKLLARIARDPAVPETLRARTAQLASDLGYEPVQQGDSARP